ncbi:hypothetical protein HNR00_004993 [Methylorubrum rhodinum]|uniref:Uncharacterized protein n=1 Tax=Methylorubrum rhodinum TaxID=29428 RepID=A0A840ZT03_9HYPH|nr:hypothetical protein [Methylorubrum rhodinum]MBB5760244.1 hypothetical protein [Methylorubrum rhodinum]
MTGNSAELRYPIPSDGQTLRSGHLHGLALLAVRQSALGAQAGPWGLFVPPGQQPGNCNVVTVKDGLVSVENLAILTATGIALRADRLETKLKSSGDDHSGLTVSWTLPEKAISEDEGAPILLALSLMGAGQAHSVEALGYIAAGANRRAKPNWVATAPLVTLGATPETAAAATELNSALDRIAAATETSARAPAFARLLVRTLLLSCRPFLTTGNPTAVMAKVCESVMSSLALMRAFGTESEAGEAKRLEAEVLPPPSSGADAILRWMVGLCELLDEDGVLNAWLRGSEESLLPLPGFPISVGGAMREFRYAVPKDAARLLRLRFEGDDASNGDAPLFPVILARFGDEPFKRVPLGRADQGFTAAIEPDSGGGNLELRVPVRIEPVVTTVKGT